MTGVTKTSNRVASNGVTRKRVNFLDITKNTQKTSHEPVFEV